MTLNKILESLEEASESKREKGSKFEKLMKNWFLTTKLYADNIKNIWLWDEFPYRNQFGGSDNGIDLVIYNEEDEFIAVQCKFYSPNVKISKSDVDTFISTSAKLFEVNGEMKKFLGRIFVSTTNKWSKNANDLIQNQEIPVIRLSLNELENSDVDWSKIYLGKLGNEAKKEGKTIRKHQKEARDSVHEYFKENNRGKLIMACGTGKTFTSLKIAENETNKNGLILFLVPSLALLGQTLREWTNDVDNDTKLYPICICSDSKISSKKSTNDDNVISVVDLALPATTDTDKIVNQLKKIKDKKGMKVVFSTYQSIDVIAKAQEKILAQDKNFGEFDLIICDEAHRTTGVTLKNEDESNFVKVHKNDFLKAKKRLYMTATPRLYDDNSKSKAKESDAYLCSMDDKKLYGEEIYRIGFGKAVENNLLADYKVLILTLSSSQIPIGLQNIIANGEKEFNFDDATRLIGCINGLSKQILDKEGIIKSTDPEPMKRAVAFCRDIKTSKRVTNSFNDYSEEYLSSLKEEAKRKMVSVASKHIDGGMNALEREDLLSWLKEDGEEQECRILTNARCLSEGVDVPNLDAVLFLSAKNSQVDVVQSVGRVMRKAPNKKYGYIIIPVVIPEHIKPEEALNDNETYKVVWSVLNALRAHDDRFNAVVNKIDINKKKPKNIIIGTPDNSGIDFDGEVQESGATYQQSLPFPIETVQNAIYAKMVEKVGDRKYFEQWAKDVAKIAQIQIDRIRDLIARDGEHKKAFNNFVKGLQENINSSIDNEEAIEMLSQHIITKPIFEALFENYSFVKNNPISSSMEEILNLLLKQQFEKETAELKEFYDDVRVRVGNIDNSEGKQKIILELYEKFFRTAFPKLVKKLGIVYTPIEVVDFIINSVEDILKKEFNRSLTEENINILEPFVGTGTFISRLLQSGNIKPKDLERKYKKEIFANEIVLLAYYIATVNIENIYHDLNSETEYKEFQGICLTDTFQLGEDKGELQLISNSFKENSERVRRQKNAPLQIIFGNPPYTIGQNSANDNAQNKKYPILDNRILETYSKESSAGLNKALYDAYIKAFRWATDRLNNNGGGIIGFVTNGAWIDGTATSGFRKTIEKEFTSIYVFNLRGNARTSGEQRKKEKGNIFGEGSKTPIAITLLAKNPNEKRGKAKIYYYDIGDYLSREEKLSRINDFKSIGSKKMDWQILKPNEKGDWINHRNKKFDAFIPLFDKNNKNNKNVFFNTVSNGIVTNRDPWVYSFSKNQLEKQMKDTIDFYNKQVEIIKNKELESNKLNTKRIEEIINTDTKKISWSRGLKNSLKKLKKDEFKNENISISLYRPFVKQNLYFSKKWIETPSQQNKFKGKVLFTNGKSSSKPFSVFISEEMINLDCLEKANCYPLKYIDDKKNTKDKSMHILSSDNELNDGITDFIHNLAKQKYSTKITKEDIFYYVYGFLHNEDYKKEFEADLKKLIPRLPLVNDYKIFKTYSDIGRKLADLHLNYENIERDKEIIVEGEKSNNFIVEKMRFTSKDKKDVIIFNSDIKIKNIPLEAYDYQVNGKSAIEWIMERYAVTMNEDNQIENNPNLWCEENKKPRYILDLLLSVISLSIKTNELIKKLPKIEF